MESKAKFEHSPKGDGWIVRTAARLAYGYALVVAALNALVFGSSLLLHLAALTGERGLCEVYGSILARAAIFVGFLAVAFLKDGPKLREQVTMCPTWMWKTARVLAVYAGAVLVLQVLFSSTAVFSDRALLASAFPLGLAAIQLCVLYPVLWLGYLDRRDLAKRLLASVVMVAWAVMVFLAHRGAGRLNPQAP